MLKRFDMFGAIEQFSTYGGGKYTTSFGGVISILLVTFMIGYAFYLIIVAGLKTRSVTV